MKKQILLIFLALLAVTACGKSLDETMADLKSPDAQVRQAAIERLGREGQPLEARLVEGLSTADDNERRAIFTVLRQRGASVMEAMIGRIGMVFDSREVREGFTEYFRSLGDAGYTRLLSELLAAAEQEKQALGPAGSVETLAQLHHRFESLSLILESLDNNLDVGKVPDLLRHEYGQVRTRAAFLLCVKGWAPKNSEDGILFYTHLINTLACPNVPEPVEEAARLAAADFNRFLALEKQYPAGGDARERVLAAAGTEPIAQYLYKLAVATPDEYLLYNYFQVLKKMESEAGMEFARKLLRDPRTGASLRAVDPEAGEGLL